MTTDSVFSFFNQTPSISTLLKTADMCVWCELLSSLLCACV